MKFSKWGYFFLGILLTATATFFGTNLLQTTEGPAEKLKIAMLLFTAIGAVGAFLSPHSVWNFDFSVFSRRPPEEPALPLSRKQTSGKKTSRAKIKVEINTAEIQGMLNELAQKTRQANEMFFNQKMDLQNKSILELSQSMGVDLPEDSERELTDPNRKIKL